ncbi:MAG TPA: carbohydrate kinase family protein [Fimbriimonadaceae bacterium]|nr:carbohydrate kinase family protein [Fimbriimonadaceae bacterium]
MRRGILAGGNFIVDAVKTIDVWPREQALANIRREYSGSGGSSYNVLLCLAKLGCEFPLAGIGRIGDDEAGRSIVEHCRRHGIDVSRLIVSAEAPTSYTLVFVVESTGRRTFFHQRGANALLADGDFDFSAFGGWHFHFGYPLLLDRLDAEDAEFGTAGARVLARARRAGLTTSVDLVSEDGDRFGVVVPPLLKHADIAFMNEFEASRLTGLGLSEPSPSRVREARDALGFAGTLVVHWAEGAAACPPTGEVEWQPSVRLPQEKIASVAGSGDAFAAGYLLGFARDLPERARLRLGVCAAASSVMGFTCTDAVSSEEECFLLEETYGFNRRPLS